MNYREIYFFKPTGFTQHHFSLKNGAGFTLLEILVVISILGLLSTMVFASLRNVQEKAFLSQGQAQVRQIVNALEFYLDDSGGDYPPDESRDIPPELVPYLGVGDWPDGPWPDSVYDWDNWVTGGGEQIYQISIRFCPSSGSPVSDCNFPNQEWVNKPTPWNARSSAYYCIAGPCRAHIDDINHPGYCLNCSGCKSTPCP